MTLLKPTDFEQGKYKISQNTYSDLQTYIDKYEPLVLMELMGAELYKLYVLDLDANKLPQTLIYLSIYNAFAIDMPINGISYPFYYGYEYQCTSNIVISNGIKEMLMGFIYFEYMRDLKVRSTATGFVINQSENSKNASFSESNIYTNYNDSIKSYKAIQYYIRKNTELYPLYNGSNKEAICFAL